MPEPLRIKPISKEDAQALALAHVLNEPVEIQLSTGDRVHIWSVSPKTMFRIAEQKERLRFALAQYRAFQAAAEDPKERAWEHGHRLPYWNRRWLVELEQTCEMMLTTSLSTRMKGWVVRWKEKRRIRQIMRRASFQDWMKIVDQYRRFHDIEAIAEIIFGPLPEEKAGEKKTPQPSGPTSSSPLSGSGASLSMR